LARTAELRRNQPACGSGPYFPYPPASSYGTGFRLLPLAVAVGEREDMLNAMQGWERPFKGDTDEALAKTLPNVLQTRRWFGGKARRIETVRIVESIVIPTGSVTKLLLICVEYENGGGEMYTLPVTAAFGEEADRIQ